MHISPVVRTSGPAKLVPLTPPHCGTPELSSLFGGSRSRLERDWALFAERGDRIGQLMTAAAALESYQFDWSGFERALLWTDRLQVCLSASDEFPSRDLELRVYANLLFALVYLCPIAEQTSLCAARLRTLFESDVYTNNRVFAGRCLLLAYCSVLDLESAEEITRRLRSLLRDKRCTGLAQISTLNAVAYGLWFECAYSEAAVVMRQAINATRDRQWEGRDPLHYHSRHLVAYARRDRNEMAETVQAIRHIARPNEYLGLAILCQALAEQAVLRGDLAGAATHWSDAVLHADAARAHPLQWTSRLALAGCRASLDECASASEILQDVSGLLVGMPAAAWSREQQLVAAYIALRRGDRPECHRLLTKAFDVAPHFGSSSQVFRLLPTAMAEVCLEATRVWSAAETGRSLIKYYRLSPPDVADRDWPWPFKVHVLGPFRVFKGEEPLRFSRRMQKRTLELLQALIAFGGTDVSAGTLTDALWPDSDGDAAYHALEGSLYRLRQLLGEPSAIIMSGGKLTLDRDYFWVDIWAFERAVQGGAEHGCDWAARFARIGQLYGGHFLEKEFDKPWAIDTRQALRSKFLRAIREAARRYEIQHLWEDAANVYQRGIELDSIAEDLYRGLMVCHRELGDHTEAMQVYRRCRDVLTRVLGMQPSAKTQAIYNSIRGPSVATPEVSAQPCLNSLTMNACSPAPIGRRKSSKGRSQPERSATPAGQFGAGHLSFSQRCAHEHLP
jgi:LuxR family transcriptional regulator, maltose regulon positive regulatory protein